LRTLCCVGQDLPSVCRGHGFQLWHTTSMGRNNTYVETTAVSKVLCQRTQEPRLTVWKTPRDASSFSRSNAAEKSRKGTRPGSHMACKDVRCGRPVPERRTPTIGFAGITGAESGVEPVEKPRLSFHDRQQGPSTGPRVETSLAPSTGAARCAHPQMRHAVRVVGSFWLPYKNL
jgi:hypothetical protein